MRVLNVAEKPSVAKEIAQILSNGHPQRRTGVSPYNPVFEFNTNFQSRSIQMIVTSVSGHLMEIEFSSNYKSWTKCSPLELFQAPILKNIKSDEASKKIAKNLQVEAKKCQCLILWLDCDREGENIAFEVKQICENANPRSFKPNNQQRNVYRAHFSALIPQEIKNAFTASLSQQIAPNPHISAACDARSEIDLRLGAAFTRFQTLRLQNKYALNVPPNQSSNNANRMRSNGVISYGPCQFPTLGFVVERYLKIQSFVPEDFHYISVRYTYQQQQQQAAESSKVDFTWERGRLFDFAVVLCIYNNILMPPCVAKVISNNTRPTSKKKPIPLATVSLQQNCSRYLNMSSSVTMAHAEKLYQAGLISYPRTETEVFHDKTDLKSLVAIHEHHTVWGEYAQSLVNNFEWPRSGTHDDKAHPPIHPIKCVPLNEISDPQQAKIYELVCRHFLACCSKDAQGQTSKITIQLGGEFFFANGLQIVSRNYLDIYKYDKWTSTSLLPDFMVVGYEFQPQEIYFKNGSTMPPSLLTESELIGIMDSNGIGTDATIAEHINTILKRSYSVKIPMNSKEGFKPTSLGLALVTSYQKMGLALAKPYLRAAMEKDCTLIAAGRKRKEQVISDCLAEMRNIFIQVNQSASVLDETMSEHFDLLPSNSTHGNADSGHATSISNSTCIKSQFAICGHCKLKTLDLREVENSNSQKFYRVFCNPCSRGYDLPRSIKKFQVLKNEMVCPLCDFQVLEAFRQPSPSTDKFRSKKNSFYVCPYCYNNRKSTDIEDTNSSSMPCFTCSADCVLATGIHFPSVRTKCQSCQSCALVLKKVSSQEIRYVVSCKGYPSCSTSYWLPSNVEKALMVNPHDKEGNNSKICNQCSDGTNKVQKLFILFRKGSVPSDIENVAQLTNNGWYEACLFCDSFLRGFDIPRKSRELDTLPQPLEVRINTTNRKDSRSPQGRSIYHTSGHSSQTHVGVQLELSGNSMSGRAYEAHNASVKNIRNSTNSFLAPVCSGHNTASVLRVTRKQGPNLGREFYTCSHPQETQCGYFQWKDELINNKTSSSSVNYSMDSRSSQFTNQSSHISGSSPSRRVKRNSEIPRCSCNAEAIQLTCRNTANKGRQFYKCAQQDRDMQCNFFEWADESDQKNNDFTKKQRRQ